MKIQQAWQNYTQLTRWQKTRKAFNYIAVAGIFGMDIYNSQFRIPRLKKDNVELSHAEYAHWDLELIFRSIVAGKTKAIVIKCTNANGDSSNMTVAEYIKQFPESEKRV